jgi:hypothetical protein
VLTLVQARVTDEFGVAAGDRTWRAPLSYRAAVLAGQTVPVAAAAAFGWVTLSSNQLPGAAVLAVWVPLWILLVFRAWTISATLAEDTLVIRNILSTERILVADITKVTLPSRGRPLVITEGRPASSGAAQDAASARHRDPGERYTVTAVQVGVMAALSGTRCAGDDAADLIAAAAGLPPLPPRRPRVSREMSLIMIPAGIALFACAAVLSATGHLGQNPLGMGLKALGAALFLLAVTAELGRFLARHRT